MQLPDAKLLLALSVLVGLLAWETIHPFLPFPKGRRRLHHGFGNILLGVINGLMTTLGFVGFGGSRPNGRRETVNFIA